MATMTTPAWLLGLIQGATIKADVARTLRNVEARLYGVQREVATPCQYDPISGLLSDAQGNALVMIRDHEWALLRNAKS